MKRVKLSSPIIKCRSKLEKILVSKICYTLAISKVIAIEYEAVFPQTTVFPGLISAIFHNVLKFLSVPGQLSLEVTNMPGTIKALGSNLTRTCFFFQTGDVLFQIKIVGQSFVCLSFIGLVVTFWNCFLFAARMLILVFDLHLQFA